MENESCSLNSAVAEIEISYMPKIKPSARPQIIGQIDVYQLFIDTWDKTKIELVEQFKVMLLNKANRVLGICTLTTGNVSGTIADPKQVFAVALKANAPKIIIAHNHPSGNLIPSASDYGITRTIKSAGDFLDIDVIDHLIITVEGFYSFANEGAL